jgi:RNA polymerase sigma-70 factor (ECF subfamily)
LEQYGPVIYSRCRRAGMAPEDAADVLQEVFESAFRGIQHFHHQRGRGALQGWLWTIATNKIRDHFRCQQTRPRSIGGTDAWERLLNFFVEEKDSSSFVGDLALRVRSALATIRVEFEETTWRAFWQTAVEGLATRAVAEQCRTTQGAVRQAKYRVLRRLRDELGDKLV